MVVVEVMDVESVDRVVTGPGSVLREVVVEVVEVAKVMNAVSVARVVIGPGNALREMVEHLGLVGEVVMGLMEERM